MFLDEMAAGEPQRRWPEWLIHSQLLWRSHSGRFYATKSAHEIDIARAGDANSTCGRQGLSPKNLTLNTAVVDIGSRLKRKL